MKIQNSGGIVNRGGHVTISGQAIGSETLTPTDLEGDDVASDNTGILNLGGTVTVHQCWVNGEWVE